LDKIEERIIKAEELHTTLCKQVPAIHGGGDFKEKLGTALSDCIGIFDEFNNFFIKQKNTGTDSAESTVTDHGVRAK
jgi:hypothetical protein